MTTPDYGTNDPKGWNGDPRRGAAMGRPTIAPDPRSEAELLADFATAAKAKSDALRLKEDRPRDCYKVNAWEAAAAMFAREMEEIKALLPLAKARETAAPRITLRRVRLDSGGYDPNGTYYGQGDPLYWAANDAGDYDVTFRAADRDEAKNRVRETYPAATFYN